MIPCYSREIHNVFKCYAFLQRGRQGSVVKRNEDESRGLYRSNKMSKAMQNCGF